MESFDVVIIGNSAGAIGCIEGIRSKNSEMSIAVISEETHHVYSRALIPYYLAGRIDLEKIYYRPLDFYEKMSVTPILGKKAVAIDFKSRKVMLNTNEEIGYEKLLISTGGKPFIPPMEGLEKSMSNVFSFVSLDDAIGIEKLLKAGAKKAIILGGGVIGLMAAEVLNERGIEVDVVELADRVLAPVVDEKTSELVEYVFRQHDVKIHTGKTIKKVNGEDRVTSVTLTDGTEIPCDLLIMAVGVIPRVELVESTEVKVNRGILVNRKMETSVKDVYACGDCAEVYDFVVDDVRVLPLWPNAYFGGRIAGLNMIGEEREFDWGTAMNAMHFYDVYIINAGLNVTEEIAEKEGFDVLSNLDFDKKIYRRVALKNGVIQGLVFVGKVERAGIYLNLMRKRIDVSGFKDELLEYDFGFSKLPDDVRWNLLQKEVILGVI